MNSNKRFDSNNFPWLQSSIISCIICIVFWGGIYYPKWNNKSTEATISYDVSGYYLYLPAIFIYKDIKQVAFIDNITNTYHPAPNSGQVFPHEKSGNKIMKYSIGQAIHFLPWFLCGHFAAILHSGYPADGFSYPYQFAIGFGMMIYCFIGIFFLYRILIEYFSKAATALTALAIVLGSNYLEYGGISNAMTHNTLFTNYCILIWLSIQFYKNPRFLIAGAIGAIVGLNALTRPTELISLIIPILWGVNILDWNSISLRLSTISKHINKYILAIIICASIGSIQLLYWKYVSGEWIVYSYQEQGFSWLRPHLKAGIFSFKTGWLVYSPIMLLSILGFLYLYKKKDLFWTSFIFTSLFIYICFAWDIWWYGGSLGQRAMVQSYPILAFPIAACIERGMSSLKLRIIFSSFLAFCIFYNFWLTHHAHKGGALKPGFMTKTFYFDTVLESDLSKEQLKLLDTDEIFEMERMNISEVNSLEQDMSDSIFVLNQNNPFTGKHITRIDTNTSNWIRASAICKIEQKEWDVWGMTQLVLKFLNRSEEIKTSFIRVDRLLDSNTRKRIYMDAKIPKENFDEIQLYLWNPGQKTMKVSQMKLEFFD